jgi:hypothetical protein
MRDDQMMRGVRRSCERQVLSGPTDFLSLNEAACVQVKASSIGTFFLFLGAGLAGPLHHLFCILADHEIGSELIVASCRRRGRCFRS